VSTVSPVGPTVRPVTSTTVDSVSPVGPKVRPVTVVSPSRASPTKQKTIVSVIRSTSAIKVAEQEPLVSTVKVTMKETDTDDSVEKIAPVPVRPSRQQRVTKRMFSSRCYFDFYCFILFFVFCCYQQVHDRLPLF